MQGISFEHSIPAVKFVRANFWFRTEWATAPNDVTQASPGHRWHSHWTSRTCPSRHRSCLSTHSHFLSKYEFHPREVLPCSPRLGYPKRNCNGGQCSRQPCPLSLHQGNAQGNHAHVVRPLTNFATANSGRLLPLAASPTGMTYTYPIQTPRPVLPCLQTMPNLRK